MLYRAMLNALKCWKIRVRKKEGGGEERRRSGKRGVKRKDMGIPRQHW
jgi:hypothetical protein